MGRTCLQRSWGSTLEVFCLWNSPLGTPAPDSTICSSRSAVSLAATSRNKTWVSLGHFYIPLFPETMVRVPLKAAKGALKAVRLPTSTLGWRPGRLCLGEAVALRIITAQHSLCWSPYDCHCPTSLQLHLSLVIASKCIKTAAFLLANKVIRGTLRLHNPWTSWIRS